MSGKLGRRAVVVGAGIGELSAAGVLAKYFDQIDVLERDQTPLSVETRSGTPQDNHAHGLLAGGLKALNEIYQDFDRDLAAAGAVCVNVPGDIRYEKPGVAELPQRDFGISMLSASRPLIESVLRRRTLAAGNVLLWSNCRVTEFLSTSQDEAAVQAVQFDTRTGPTRTLDTDLVIDASGRGTLALGFLRTLGWEQPPTTRIGVDITYSTAIVAISAHSALDWKVALTPPDPPYQPLNAVLLPAEGNRWMISVADRGVTSRIDDWDAFLGRSGSADYHDASRCASTCAPPFCHPPLSFSCKHLEAFRTTRPVATRHDPIGDAICMSAAAQQSRLLQTVLANAARESDPLSAAQVAFMSGIEAILQTPWTMAVNSDLAFPQTQATRPENFGRTQESQAPLFQAIVNDPIVHRAFVEISHLLQPYSLLRTPAIGARIGGHIALEMASQFSGIKGLLISGAPPVSRYNMAEGFIPTPHMKLAGQQYLGPSEIDAFREAIFGTPMPVAFRRAIERADGLARKTIFEAARLGVGIDQRCLVESLAVPLAVVNGSQDPFIHLDYLEVPKYANLWEGRCHRLPGLKHAPFWEAPDVFDELFSEDSSTMSLRDDLRRCRNAELRDQPSIPNSMPSIGRYTTSLDKVTRCDRLFSL